MASLRVFMSVLALYLSCFVLNSDHSLSKSSTCLSEKHKALFIFGDSLFDSGNNDYINTTTFFQANFSPYGRTFFKYPTGRFSDGRVIPDFIAQHAELPLLPPYLHPGYHIDDYIYGVNFASAGAGALVETNRGLANFSPYGRTFFKYPTGRFSDGRVIPDFIAQHAELPLLPPYLHPGYHIDDYIYGVNFASAGAGALVETNRGLVINLKTQINYHKEVSKQFKQKLGDVEAKRLLSGAVYLFSIGGNDYGTPFLTNSNSGVVLPYPQQKFVDFVVGNITAAIKEIYNEGGRKFGFVNVGPLNCFPLLRRLVNITTISACMEEGVSALARLHNNVFSKVLQKLEDQLEGFKYSNTDFYGALVELMKFPSKYGFEEGNVACCGGGPYRGDYSCGGKRGIEEYELCENVNEYVFFDSLHPTESAAEHFAKLMWSGNTDVIKSYNLKQLFDYV